MFNKNERQMTGRVAVGSWQRNEGEKKRKRDGAMGGIKGCKSPELMLLLLDNQDISNNYWISFPPWGELKGGEPSELMPP